MIKSFADKKTGAFAEGQHTKEFSGFRRQAEKRLDILESAESLGDLAALPSNRLAALRGERKGQYSVRINRQWGVCFGYRV
jgi:proteic killer suppression protein